MLFVLAFISLAASSRAGTVITSNLPPGTAIVNINATEDGASAYNSDQSLWYHPFYTGGASQLLEYTVQAGTYSFRVIDPADSAQLFPTLTSNQLAEIFTAWTFNSPWVTDYLVFDSAAATNSALPQLFDGAFSNTNGVWTTYSDANAAYGAAVSNGFYNLVRGGPEGRDGLTYSNYYTFPTNEALVFVVPDYDLGDNAGGVSVLVTPTTAPPPPLAIQFVSPDSVVVSWPSAGNHTLQQSPVLPGTAWTDNTNTVATVGATNSITITPPQGDLFFRLKN